MTSPAKVRELCYKLDAELRGHIHAGLRSAPTTKSYKRWYDRRLNELFAMREAAYREYYAAVDSGEIVVSKPSRIERLRATAAGHPDNPSVQAARRLLAAEEARLCAK